MSGDTCVCGNSKIWVERLCHRCTEDAGFDMDDANRIVMPLTPIGMLWNMLAEGRRTPTK